jgi:hypothetical protein
LNAQLRLPAKTSDLRAIQENERAVSNPSSLAPRINTFRIQVKVASNPTDRIVHLAILISAKVENIYFLFALFNGEKHGINTILDVEVGFLLLAIA